MIDLWDKLLAAEVAAEFEDSEVERISLLLVGVPVDGSARVLL